jgi:hypothetical protein
MCHCCPGDYVSDDKRYEFDATSNGAEVSSRHCTDVFPCLIFVAFVIGLFVVLFVSLPKSNYKFIYIPTDHRGLL